ncbi:MAG: hypothetical protein HY854_08990 [Burkholderiales bacterium]|nr:hypothetical protein [Burkholderiales bacterium]
MKLVRAAAACLLGLLVLATGAWAHDSWLAPAPAGGWVLHTGSRYPHAEGPGVPAPVTCGGGSCWVQTGEAHVELEPGLVETYLREIRPPAAIEHRWDAMREAGVAWHERYSKFARVDMAGTASRIIAGAPLEIVSEGRAMRVLSYARPVAGQSVELVSESGEVATWSRSDREGRVYFDLPRPGRYLVRAVRLAPDGLRWRSHFATLALTRPGRASPSAPGR